MHTNNGHVSGLSWRWGSLRCRLQPKSANGASGVREPRVPRAGREADAAGHRLLPGVEGGPGAPAPRRAGGRRVHVGFPRHFFLAFDGPPIARAPDGSCSLKFLLLPKKVVLHLRTRVPHEPEALPTLGCVALLSAIDFGG